jgi:amidase
LTFVDDRLPIGAHFAAARGADAVLLQLAYQLEDARPWRKRWPPLSMRARSTSRPSASTARR